MRRIGLGFQRNLEQSIDRQVDLNGAPFIPVKLSTAKQRQGASNKIQKVARASGVRGRIKGTVKVRKITGALSMKRLLFTGQFVHGAFGFEPRSSSVRVFASKATYPGESVSFSDIVSYNNSGSGDSKIPHPKIFPLTPSEVEKMEAHKHAVGILTGNNVLKKLFGEGIKKQFVIEF